MKKRKGRRPRSLESEGEPRNNADSQALFQGRVQRANLGDKPIEDLLLEKRLADRGGKRRGCDLYRPRGSARKFDGHRNRNFHVRSYEIG